MIISGHGTHYVAHINEVFDCPHCKNKVKRIVRAGYSQLGIVGFADYEYNQIYVLCPICEHGHAVHFVEGTAGKIRSFFGKSNNTEDKDALLDQLRRTIDIVSTKRSYDSGSNRAKKTYQRMMKKLGLTDILQKIALS